MTTTYAHSAAPTAGPGADRPVRPVEAMPSVHGGQPVPASAGSHSAALRVDLCGLDYYLSRPSATVRDPTGLAPRAGAAGAQ